MSTVTLDQMRGRLLSLSDVEKVLASTEPLTSSLISSGTPVHFEMGDDWNRDLDGVTGTDPVDVTMSIDGVERQMTLDAALMAASRVGLTQAYVKRTPPSLIQSHLNYWYGEGIDEDKVSVLAVGEHVAAFTKPTLTPFSNLSLLESAVAGIQQTYGKDTEILADYKILHSLERTDLRLIIPEQQRTITNGGLADVPVDQADLWCGGVHLSNSLTGKRQTGFDAYMFRWWCTNGAITTMDGVGTWSRRASGQEADVYVWAQEAVDEILGGMESRFDEIQALTSLNVAGNTADILRDIYTQYEIPVSQRSQITDTLLESETLSMYAIMNAITQTANDPTLDPRRADRMMRIGGEIPTSTFDSIKAKVWSEGHSADPTAPNPYLITSLS